MKQLRQLVKHPALLTLKGAELFPDKMPHHITKETRDEMLDLVRDAHIFLFDAEFVRNFLLKHKSAERPLALPFKVCWFELTPDINNTVPLIAIESPAWTVTGEKGVGAFGQLGVLCKEIAPNEYDLFCLEMDAKNHASSVTVFRNAKDLDLTSGYGLHLASPIANLKFWLGLLSHGVLGVEHTEAAIHLPRPDRISKTKPHRINRIIHVTGARELQQKEGLGQKKEIDWSHRWEVRGHWRKIDDNATGKDREGEYRVSGWTWVTSHEKGRPTDPLIRKVRNIREST